MIELLEKIKSLALEWRVQKGPFKLFAVIEREDVTRHLLDIVVSAQWIPNENIFLTEFSKSLREKLTDREMLKLSRVVILNISEPFVNDFLNKWSYFGKSTMLDGVEVKGIEIRHAWVIDAEAETSYATPSFA
jgi:hypothetical protein